MKTLILSITILFSNLLFSAGTDSLYENAMLQAMEKQSSISSFEDAQSNLNDFERIMNAKKDAWLPAYYAAYNLIVMSFMEKESSSKKDNYLDKADEYIAAATEKGGDESELLALQGYSYQARISINTMVRGMTYGPRVSTALNKAIALNEANPRAHFLLGQNLAYTPEFFGGGMDKACVHFTNAKAKYDLECTDGSLMPNWGKERNEQFLGKCSAE